MFAQSFMLVAATVVLAGAILSSGLITARAAAHQAMFSRVHTALSDATADFLASTQLFVEKYGTEQQIWPVRRPVIKPMCFSDDGLLQKANIIGCAYFETVSWVVTGTSAKPGDSASPSDVAIARYLANTVDEQRISATIAVQIADATGNIVYARRSQEITARLFTAAPYVVITGVRDIGANVGGFRASEGDTGGAVAQTANSIVSIQPNPSFPAAYTDTRILTTIDCVNSTPTAAGPIPNAYFDSRYHRYGNHVWAYESSCASGIYATNGAPADYVPSGSAEFFAAPANPQTLWNTGAEETGAFPR